MEAAKPKRKLVPVGIQPARCFAIVDLGTQQETFQGKPKDPVRKVLFIWELTKFMVTYKEGDKPEPLTVKQQYALSAGKKAKFPDVLKSWGTLPKRPEKIGNDLLQKYLGAPCMLTIEHSEDGQWSNVGGSGRAVSPFMKDSFEPPIKHNTPIFFDLDAFSWEQFHSLQPWIQNIIRKSEEFPAIAAKNPEPIGSGSIASPIDEPLMADDDLPF